MARRLRNPDHPARQPGLPSRPGHGPGKQLGRDLHASNQRARAADVRDAAHALAAALATAGGQPRPGARCVSRSGEGMVARGSGYRRQQARACIFLTAVSLPEFRTMFS